MVKKVDETNEEFDEFEGAIDDMDLD